MGGITKKKLITLLLVDKPGEGGGGGGALGAEEMGRARTGDVATYVPEPW